MSGSARRVGGGWWRAAVALSLMALVPALSAGSATSVIDDPVALAVVGPHLFVVNESTNAVVEYSTATGALVKVIDAPADAFHHPDGIAVSGLDLFVSNGNEESGMGTTNYSVAQYSSVTELDATTGSLVRVINAPADHLLAPGPIAVGGGHVWVVNQDLDNGVSLVELDAASGSLVRLYKDTTDGLFGSLGVAVGDGGVWVTNASGQGAAVTELNETTGSLVRVIKSKYNLVAPDPVSVDGSRVWVGNIALTDNAVSELNASNGSLVRIINGAADGFDGLIALDTGGAHVWVANGSGNSITELRSADGSLVKVIRAAADALDGPDAVTVASGDVWVADVNGGAVTELNASTGALVRVIR